MMSDEQAAVRTVAALVLSNGGRLEVTDHAMVQADVSMLIVKRDELRQVTIYEVARDRNGALVSHRQPEPVQLPDDYVEVGV